MFTYTKTATLGCNLLETCGECNYVESETYTWIEWDEDTLLTGIVDLWQSTTAAGSAA